MPEAQMPPHIVTLYYQTAKAAEDATVIFGMMMAKLPPPEGGALFTAPAAVSLELAGPTCPECHGSGELKDGQGWPSPCCYCGGKGSN
jgi:hypothetical protein